MNLTIISIITAGLILGAWIMFNPNKRYRKGNYFLPPAEVHPAEAGVFVDDTANFEELIGTIFHWAHKGYIAIEEADAPISDMNKIYDAFTHNQDYVLHKKSELPQEAMNFEKELFQILFSEGKEYCDIRSLKGNVYQDMEMVIAELKKEIDAKGYYKWDTRNIGEGLAAKGRGMFGVFRKMNPATSIKIILLLVITGLIIPYGVIAWGLTILGKIIPIKNRAFREAFTVAKHFERFIQSDEPVEAYIIEDKKYFNKTLAYAAAMGKGFEWSARCSEYIENVPEWYKGYGEYTKADFIQFMDKSYYVFKSAFTSEVSNIENFRAKKRYIK